MKSLGAVLLTVGFLAGAFVSVVEVASIPWGPYAGCAGVMVVGMLILSRARAAARAGATDQHAADVASLRQHLDRLIEKVRGFEAVTGDEEQLTVHRRIDAELMTEINGFVEARESMIPHYGMQRYADVMAPFANGERLVNRAWSASADGYVDEVRRCIQGARQEWERAAAELAAAGA